MRPGELLADRRLRAALRCLGGCLLTAAREWLRPSREGHLDTGERPTR
ncbi:hypothetical protein ACFWPA_03475 [Rhodococcus sp. NPDC058505]